MDDMVKTAVNPISRLSVPTEDEVHESVKPIIEQNKKLNGYVENWIISLALNPGTLTRTLNHYESLFSSADSDISPAEKEIIAVIVSAENGCVYCETHHTHILAKIIDDPIRARRIALGYDHVTDLTLREQAFGDLAIKITRDPKTVTEADLNGLRELGIEDRTILEVIEIAAFFNYTNRVAIPLNNIPEDNLFKLD
jgi:uncharacterized peroxidase-related enzyme